MPRNKFKKGNIEWKHPNVGLHQFKVGEKKSDNWKKKVIGRIPWNKGLKGFGRSWNIGRKKTEETKMKISKAKIGKPGLIGSKNPAWKGGLTPKNTVIRRSIQYKTWRRAVMEKYNFTCFWCKRKGCTINAHHIKHFSEYPEERFNVNNGIVLCEKCHKRWHSDEKRGDLRKAYFKIIDELAYKDDKLIFITGDLGYGHFEEYAKNHPKQFINGGICEQGLVGIAAGMALGGLHPHVYSGSVFIICRAYEQVRNDVAWNNTNVKLIGTGAASFLGFSHNWTGWESEENLLKHLPLKRFYPKDETELREALTTDGPAFIRI